MFQCHSRSTDNHLLLSCAEYIRNEKMLTMFSMVANANKSFRLCNSICICIGAQRRTSNGPVPDKVVIKL